MLSEIKSFIKLITKILDKRNKKNREVFVTLPDGFYININ